MSIGIIGAMSEEVSGLISLLTNVRQVEYAGLTFYQGKLIQKPVVIVQCGVGKVNAAMCTQLLIDHFAVKAVINTGVAGGIDPLIEIGDVVISQAALQHDFDTTVFGYKPGIIPSLKQSVFSAEAKLQELAIKAAKNTVEQHRVHLGLIVSGDQFISDAEDKQYLFKTFNALCAEMEGAAVAHVASLNQVPFVIIRIISDKADNTAPDDFNEFVLKIIPDLNQIVTEITTNYSVRSDR